MQGDIVLIKNSSGVDIVRYIYDPWGNVEYKIPSTFSAAGKKSAEEIAEINPFRYRSYYYDTESNLYYLITRYYDPYDGVFISPDSFDYLDPNTIGGLNLYSYCNYNPINYVDPTGHIFFTILFAGLILGAVTGGALSGVQAYNSGARGWELFGAIAGGALVGGAIGAAAGAMIGAGAVMISTGASMIGGGLALAGLGITSGAVVTGVAVIGGGLTLTAAGVLSGLIFFASNSRPGNNKAQNKQIRDATRELGFDPNSPDVKDIINDVEHYIRKNKLSLGYKTLKELLMDFLL